VKFAKWQTNTRTTHTNFPSDFTSRDSYEVAKGHSDLAAFAKNLGWLSTSTTEKLMCTLKKHICIDGHTPLCSPCKCKCRFAAKGTHELTLILPLSGDTNERQSFRIIAPSHRASQHTGLLNQYSAHGSSRRVKSWVVVALSINDMALRMSQIKTNSRQLSTLRQV
jgi:hypothetical protein